MTIDHPLRTPEPRITGPMQKADRYAEIKAALSELSELCQSEYGIPLESVLLDGSPEAAMRLQRLTGIALKRPFANRESRASGEVSTTGANHVWPWKGDPDQTPGAHAELALLRKLRASTEIGSVTIGTGNNWANFQFNVEHERGLFKVLAAWVSDQFERNPQTGGIAEYLDRPESRKFELGLDLAEFVAGVAVTEPLARLVGVPTVTVGLALIGIQYGYRWITDEDGERLPDATS